MLCIRQCCAVRSDKPEFLQAVQEKGKYLEDKIMAMGSDKVKGVRGLGLMVGIVVDAEQRAEIVAEIMDKGVLVLTAGTNVIRLLPPLTISYEEMDEALAVSSRYCASEQGGTHNEQSFKAARLLQG